MSSLVNSCTYVTVITLIQNYLFSSSIDKLNALDLYDLFLNSDKFDEHDPDLMLTTP